ncbi:MAG: PQQ-dependent sugar dehydrogenase [Ferruginibacter sp.]
MKPFASILSGLFCLSTVVSLAQIPKPNDKLVPKRIAHTIQLKKGKPFTLYLPEGYKISIAAEGLNRVRFLSKDAQGNLFATDMFDRSDNHKGRVLRFDNWNNETKKFEQVTPLLTALHNPNQIAFYGNYVYVAETGKLNRYQYAIATKSTIGKPETIAHFPDYGLNYKYGGWHLTRSIAFHNNKLYVSVGSSCNACIEKESIRAVIQEMNPDGSNVVIYARGLRNSVGMKWVNNRLWVTGMGRDLIGPDKPEDLFHTVDKNGYYGWPFYFQYQGKIYPDVQFKDSIRAPFVKKPPVAYCGFKAHSAPLGFEWMNNFSDPYLNNSFLVCLHGSTSVWRQRGNSIVKVNVGNEYEEIVSGFLSGKTDKDRHGRPCDILQQDARSFFFTDDLKGVLYYVFKP